MIKINKGFTLAEVLITLTVVGVVAAMTMPVLVAKIQKEVTKQKLLKTQAILEEAYTRMVADANPMDATGVSQAIERGDLSKYVKVVKKGNSYYLSNGTRINLSTIGNSWLEEIYLNEEGRKPCRDFFMFTVGRDYMTHRLVHPLGTYDSLVALLGSRVKSHEEFVYSGHRDEAIAVYDDISRQIYSMDHPNGGSDEYWDESDISFNCTAKILGEKALTVSEFANYNP